MIVVVGNVGGTNVGESLMVAAAALGYQVTIERSTDAMSPRRLAQAFMWHLLGKRPFFLERFSQLVVATCRAGSARILISTGLPISSAALERLHPRGVVYMNFSIDDPWNLAHRAPWFLKGLPNYDVIFTTRRSNIADFNRAGCADVRFLPFAYDPRHFSRPSANTPCPSSDDVVFVGGGDLDRVHFFAEFARQGLRPKLIGDYWDRHRATRSFAVGHKSPSELSFLTAHAAVNLCLVRRANRDGHVMRSFQIPAVGGFMIAEDTEHRLLFGLEGECVLYFATPFEAAQKARWAIDHPIERRRMAEAAHRRITTGQNTYKDRLEQMLEAAQR
jgi:spore maturation protein CgeB